MICVHCPSLVVQVALRILAFLSSVGSGFDGIGIDDEKAIPLWYDSRVIVVSGYDFCTGMVC